MKKKDAHLRYAFGLALMVVLLLPAAAFAEPVAFQGVGAGSQKLANGDTLVRFTVRVQIFQTPLEFNYHWERSDGAKSAVQIWRVQPGTTSVPVTTTWELGPGAAQGEVWEKLFVNTGNTHLESEPVKIALGQPAAQSNPIAIHAAGAGSKKMPNGNIQVLFSVRLDVYTTPLEFNYHWERSDGAKSGVQIQKVQPGTTSTLVDATWELGPNAPVKEIWERLFINTGNTHLVSEPIKFVLP